MMLAVIFTSRASAKEVTQADIDAISDACHLDRSVMQLQGEDTLRVHPSSETKYEALDCVLKKLKEAKFPDFNMGFVGNEQSEPEADNAQKN